MNRSLSRSISMRGDCRRIWRQDGWGAFQHIKIDLPDLQSSFPRGEKEFHIKGKSL